MTSELTEDQKVELEGMRQRMTVMASEAMMIPGLHKHKAEPDRQVIDGVTIIDPNGLTANLTPLRRAIEAWIDEDKSLAGSTIHMLIDNDFMLEKIHIELINDTDKTPMRRIVAINANEMYRMIPMDRTNDIMEVLRKLNALQTLEQES